MVAPLIGNERVSNGYQRRECDDERAGGPERES